ncbi:MAG: hypothetical protein ACTTH7_07175 [Treponema sp.]
MVKNLCFVVLLFSFFIIRLPAAAQESGGSDTANLEDELFGGDEDSLVTIEQAKSDNRNTEFQFQADLNKAMLTLESNKTRIGGGITSLLKLGYLWSDPYSKKDDYTKSFLDAQSSLNTQLNANLFFDARPVENLKLYGKFLFGFPFEKQLTGSGAAFVPPAILPPSGAQLPVAVESSGVPNIKIQELYTDFSAKDIAFFRFGKHAVKWGTGYFYSPADVINLSRIDPQDPDAEREGAVSLRTHIIIPQTQHNIWLYLLPPMQNDEFKPEYTAGAAKTELVFGNWEWGIGGWYKYKQAPRFITTLSGSIAGKVAVFAEGVFAWGSDYTYYKNDAELTGYEQKNTPFFQATAGGSYLNADTHTSVAFQYFYNGFGYANTDAAYRVLEQAKNPTSMMNAAIRTQIGNVTAMGNLGQHYIAFTLAQNKIGTEKLGINLFQQFAVSEASGTTVLTMRWNIYKFVSMSTGPSFTYPLSASSKLKGTIGYSLSFNLGGGKF